MAADDSTVEMLQDEHSGGYYDDQLDSLTPEEEEQQRAQLSRILQCKRLSEGCCNRLHLSGYLARKNSLHSMMMQEAGGNLLPPVTEGVPMRDPPPPVAGLQQQQQQLQQPGLDGQHSGSASSLSLRSSSNSTSSSSGRHGLLLKRHSHGTTDELQNTSRSSSVSLDGKGSPVPGSRRRSSTVSQCSSVLSEGTRQQLNFDLSPDLAPDSSILEANALPDYEHCSERPASPEPISLDALSDERSFDMRPVSRLSNQIGSPDTEEEQYDEMMACEALAATSTDGRSPDSTLGDSHQDDEQNSSERRLEEDYNQNDEADQAQIKHNLERLISDVSAVVKVSASGGRPQRCADDKSGALDGLQRVSNKRAHTPFGANAQRNKVAPFSARGPMELSSTPPPTQISGSS